MSKSGHTTIKALPGGSFVLTFWGPPTALDMLSLAFIPRDEALELATASGLANDRAIEERRREAEQNG